MKNKVKDWARATYTKRLRQLLKSRLKGRKKVKAINLINTIYMFTHIHGRQNKLFAK